MELTLTGQIRRASKLSNAVCRSKFLAITRHDHSVRSRQYSAANGTCLVYRRDDGSAAKFGLVTRGHRPALANVKRCGCLTMAVAVRSDAGHRQCDLPGTRNTPRAIPGYARSS